MGHGFPAELALAAGGAEALVHDLLMLLRETVATPGHLLALVVTPAKEQVQAATGDTVEMAFVGQGSTGEPLAKDAAAYRMRLEVVKLRET